MAESIIFINKQDVVIHYYSQAMLWIFMEGFYRSDPWPIGDRLPKSTSEVQKRSIKDKNLIKLKQMVAQPEIFLREEAVAFKQYESIMEDQFWGSRIDTKNFSYYEN